MANPFAVKNLQFSSGERFPILLEVKTGTPLVLPTLFSIVQLRGINRSSKTIEQFLRDLIIFLIFLRMREVNIRNRIISGFLFQMHEIEFISHLCRLKFENAIQVLILQSENKSNPISLLSYGRGSKSDSETLNIGSADSKIRSICCYLEWCLNYFLEFSEIKRVDRKILHSSCMESIQALKNRISNQSSRNTISTREGLSEEVLSVLLDVIKSGSKNNPWSGEFVQNRNELMLRWLLFLGLRRGELLNIQVQDIDFARLEVTIVRRADSTDDSRKYQPLVKTRDRILIVSNELLQLTRDYILNHRRNIVGARVHKYLFVAHKTGAALSLAALNRVFRDLDLQIDGVKHRVTPHLLRHTWNDIFSRDMDSKEVSEADEQKMRSYLMGWSPTSGTASTYTKRYVRKKAREVSLAYQKKVLKGGVR